MSKEANLRYSQFNTSTQRKFIELDESMLEESAVRDANGFKKGSIFYTEPTVIQPTTERAKPSRNDIFNTYIPPLRPPPSPSDDTPETAFFSSPIRKWVEISETSNVTSNQLKIETKPVIKNTSDIKLSYLPIASNILGEGRYSIVYKGHFSTIDSPELIDCAVKRSKCSIDSQAASAAEVFVLKRLRHSSIIKLIDVLSETPSDRKAGVDTRILTVFDLYSNGTMWYRIQKKLVDSATWLKWSKQLSSALQYLQLQGVIHHDIKPHNILLNDSFDAFLSDFGNARFVPEKSPTLLEFQTEFPDTFSDSCLSPVSMQICYSPSTAIDPPPSPPSNLPPTVLMDGLGRGTLPYTAPEIFSDTIYSFPSDVYSLGVTLYVAITGQEPFANVSSSVLMLNMIKKGFFESGMQSDPFPDGPIPGTLRYQDSCLVADSVVKFIRSMVYRDPVQRPNSDQCYAFFQ